MNEIDNKEIRPGLGERMTTFTIRVARFIVRMLLIILLGASLGAVAYYSAPALYNNYIEPVQNNSQRITELEDAMMKSQSDNRLTEIGERLAGIEGRQAEQQEVLSELQVEVENLKQENEKISDLQYLVGRLDALQADLQKTADEFEALEASLAGTEGPVRHLEHQLQLVRVMELLTRARLWLTQDNLGIAAEDVQAALQALENLAKAAPEEETDTLQPIIERLEFALRALPDSPVIAADDLEIAWKLLIDATALSSFAGD